MSKVFSVLLYLISLTLFNIEGEYREGISFLSLKPFGKLQKNYKMTNGADQDQFSFKHKEVF